MAVDRADFAGGAALQAYGSAELNHRLIEIAWKEMSEKIFGLV